MPHVHPTSSAEKNLMFLISSLVSVFFKAAKSCALQIEISKLFRIQSSKEKGFLYVPLQFFNFWDMPLLFTYFEICHYNSSLFLIVPFYTYSRLMDPLADLCIFVWPKTHLLLLSFQLADMWGPHVSFFINLRPSPTFSPRCSPLLFPSPRLPSEEQEEGLELPCAAVDVIPVEDEELLLGSWPWTSPTTTNCPSRVSTRTRLGSPDRARRRQARVRPSGGGVLPRGEELARGE